MKIKSAETAIYIGATRTTGTLTHLQYMNFEL